MGARFSTPVQKGPGAHPTSCTMDTVPFLGVKIGRGVTLTPHPLLMPWSRKSRAIPLLPVCAVRPVQSHIDCARVHITKFPRRWGKADDREERASVINPLTLNDHYRGRTAPPTSKRCILYIYSTNIGTE